jgi:putative ABC transport system permease protein
MGGLALGFAVAILIGLYLRYQLSFEELILGHEQVYRLSLTIERPGNAPDVQDSADFFMAERLKLDYPRVENAARLIGLFAAVRHGDLKFHENVYCADPRTSFA